MATPLASFECPFFLELVLDTQDLCVQDSALSILHLSHIHRKSPKRQSGTLIAGLPPPRLKVSLWFIRSLMTSFVKWSMRLTWPNSKNPSGHSNVSEVDPGNQLLFGTVIWEPFSFWRDLIYIWLNI